MPPAVHVAQLRTPSGKIAGHMLSMEETQDTLFDPPQAEPVHQSSLTIHFQSNPHHELLPKPPLPLPPLPKQFEHVTLVATLA